jgi:hypothetical protein
MYVNGKMIPFQKWEKGRINDDVGRSEFKYCKNFCKCHNVPPLSTTIRKTSFSEKKECTST